MKKSIRLLSAVFAAVMLVLCFASCGGEAASEKINVEVWVYKDSDCKEPFVAANDISLNPGANVLDAVNALCEKRGCTYTMGTDNQFATVTFESTTLEGSETTLTDGNVEMKYLGWKLNGTPMIDANSTTVVLPKDQVLQNGDKIIIYIVVDVVTPAAN